MDALLGLLRRGHNVLPEGLCGASSVSCGRQAAAAQRINGGKRKSPVNGFDNEHAINKTHTRCRVVRSGLRTSALLVNCLREETLDLVGIARLGERRAFEGLPEAVHGVAFHLRDPVAELLHRLVGVSVRDIAEAEGEAEFQQAPASGYTLGHPSLPAGVLPCWNSAIVPMRNASPFPLGHPSLPRPWGGL